ncbi:MAG: hypothetical protein JNM78_17115 [Cyclobacteriaceae bacterium]|nr:hypothetical protein [Cyclobacteriaceae bacterium]
MSTLQTYLEFDLAIHPDVVELLYSRQVPKNNDYWKGRKTFLSQSPGYLFIPILFDLFLKSNLDKVLSETHLLLIEEILHSAAKQEANQITNIQHQQECHSILSRVGISEKEISRIENSLVKRPFSNFPAKYKSLQRANSYLYSTALFPHDYDMIFTHWESVMPLFLFLDDLTDLQDDIDTQSENCLLDSPGIENNFFELHPLFIKSIKPLEKINKNIYLELNRLRQEGIAATLGETILTITLS